MSRLIPGRIAAAFLILIVITAGFAAACTKEKPAPPPAPITQPAKPETIVPPPPVPVQPVKPETIVPPPPTPAQPAKPAPVQERPVPVLPPQTELLLVVRAFYLEVNGPTDRSMVRDSSVKVEGGTLPGSIVTVNGQIAALDGRGRFSVPIQLEEGPNSIEIIASDVRGTQRSQVISIIRLPS